MQTALITLSGLCFCLSAVLGWVAWDTGDFGMLP